MNKLSLELLLLLIFSTREAKAQGLPFGLGGWELAIVIPAIVTGALTGKVRCTGCVVGGYISGGSALGVGIAAGVSAINASVVHPLRTPLATLRVAPTAILDRRGVAVPALTLG